MTVLAIVTRAETAAPVLRWAWNLARAREEPLAALCVSRGAKPQGPSEVPLTPPVESELVQRAQRVLAGLPAGEASPTLRNGVHPDPAELALLASAEADLVVVDAGRDEAPDGPDRRVASRLLAEAPGHVVLLRPGTQGEGSGTGGDVPREGPIRLVVPTAGGPHARVALSLAAALVRAGRAQGRALMVVDEPDADTREAAQERLLAALKAAEAEALTAEVVVAARPLEGILRAAHEADLLLIGASNEGLIRRAFLGTIPDRVLSRGDVPTVAMVRARAPLARRTLDRLGRVVSQFVPQLEREERVRLVDSLREGSRLRTDFVALMGLATSIAALGLLQGSAATVIGAMLVAPLMTPLIATGLALVQGNAHLALQALRSLAGGFLLALSIGLTFGWIVHLPEPTGELLARGAPTLIDLGVALFSGLAAAYALARPNLSAALPGVAIAAALVPPVATVGVSLAHGRLAIAEGAALLFATNLVAIVLGSALAFQAVGVRVQREAGPRKLWVSRVVLGLFLAGAVLSVPLTSLYLSRIAPVPGPDPLPEAPLQALRARLATQGALLLRVEQVDEGLLLVLASGEAPTPALGQRLADLAAEELPATLPVRVVCVPGAWADARR